MDSMMMKQDDNPSSSPVIVGDDCHDNNNNNNSNNNNNNNNVTVNNDTTIRISTNGNHHDDNGAVNNTNNNDDDGVNKSYNNNNNNNEKMADIEMSPTTTTTTPTTTTTTERNPFSKDYIGVPTHYIEAGLNGAGTTSILYPLLVVQRGESSAFVNAANELVGIFWSYKIFFGLFDDIVYVAGRQWKPHVIMGWTICLLFLILLANMGSTVGSTTLVSMLALSNFGFIMADTATDGFMTWLAHHEPDHRRGKIQTLAYLVRQIGTVVMNVLIIVAFSGPATNCPGYEKDSNIPCTTNNETMSRNNLSKEYPNTWCYQQCDSAQFDFGMTSAGFLWLLSGITLAGIPFYFLLNEEKKIPESIKKVFSNLWHTSQRRAVWQMTLYTMTSNILFDVGVACQNNANYVFMGLNTVQNQVILILDGVVFGVGLYLIRNYCLGFSWRKMVLYGKLLVLVFSLIYLLIIYDIIRNPWFYVVFSVGDEFLYTLNWMAALYAIVEVAEDGFETVTYALISTASDAPGALSTVVSNQLLSYFPDLATQEEIAQDTSTVRNQLALLYMIVEVINLSAILVLPMLPRNRQEAQVLMQESGSGFWGAFSLVSLALIILYSSIVTFLTIAGAETYGCMPILGGTGCTTTTSTTTSGVDLGATLLLTITFLFCYGIAFYFVYKPLIQGDTKFSWGMFV